jgi:N-ethylmaleimide reductase
MICRQKATLCFRACCARFLAAKAVDEASGWGDGPQRSAKATFLNGDRDVSVENLFRPLRLGAVDIPNRIIMAPMTRSRAGAGHVATASTALYYAQRADAGLLIAEGSQISQAGQGYIRTPGIHSEEQTQAWAKVVQAVHAKGGRIALQLWHVGRMSHPLFQPGGAAPLAPSALRPEGRGMTPEGLQDYVTPRALETEEVAAIVGQFAAAAVNARRAGFDAVELHAANGYLLDQFLRDGSNKRTDRYGGSVENRSRFLLEVTAAAVDAMGPGRVGIRFSPNGAYNSMSDSDPAATFGYAAEMLNRFDLAFLHVIEPLRDDHPMSPPAGARRVAGLLRRLYKGAFIFNGGLDGPTADRLMGEGAADAAAFGVPFIANPDLVQRLRMGAPLATADRTFFYRGEDRGYIDYPTLAEKAD